MRTEERKRLAPTVMFQGTSSDVGKSILTAALCRILVQDGWRAVPFKSQNMSLNSYVTPDGKEIGRAQGMQADACGIAATTDMNPILLKPKKDMVSQVVVHGKPLRDYDARAYREEYLVHAEGVVKEALKRLRTRYDVVCIEGAGSPAEVNLKDRDIVNMRLAGWADAPVILVADIDRGGVFASIVGTLEILTPEERDRVRGFVINKFRGDVSLLKPGLDWLEERTGKPVLGVVPYLTNLGLEDEDSASLDSKRSTSGSALKRSDQLDIAVLRLPRISNFTDFDPLIEEDDVHLRYVTKPEEWGNPDAVLIPGSKNTIDDLLFLRETGLEALLAAHVAQGGSVVGICAGYQMMGRRLLDPLGVESDKPEVAGIGLFPAETTFAEEKRTERVVGIAAGLGDGAEHPISGYEIHMGRTRFVEPVIHPFRIRIHDAADDPESYHWDGAVTPDGLVWGTYVHGILHNDELRRAWLNGLRQRKGWPALAGSLRFASRREAAFDRLADHVRAHLDMARIYEIIGLRKVEFS
jgi:cobyric acid synthase CobQ